MDIKRKTIVVNIFGGPGVAKSILTAELFKKLKCKNIIAEMSREYAKELVWQDTLNLLDDQMYIFAKQNHNLFRLNNKVDVIITDSPLMLSVYYNKGNDKNLDTYVSKTFDTYENLNVFLKRNDSMYEEYGRYQNLQEAKNIDNEIENILYKYNIGYRKIVYTERTSDIIIDDILVRMGEIDKKN